MAILVTTRVISDNGDNGDTVAPEVLAQLADASVGQVVWYPDDPQGTRVGVVEHAYAGLDLKSVTLSIRVDEDAVIFIDRAPSDWRFSDK